MGTDRRILLLSVQKVSRMMTSHSWCWVLKRVGESSELAGCAFLGEEEREVVEEEENLSVAAGVDSDWSDIAMKDALFDWMMSRVGSSDWKSRVDSSDWLS